MQTYGSENNLTTFSCKSEIDQVESYITYTLSGIRTAEFILLLISMLALLLIAGSILTDMRN